LPQNLKSYCTIGTVYACRVLNWCFIFIQGVNNAEVVKKMSVSDKMKFFEKAMEEQHQPSPKPGRPFESSLTLGSTRVRM
jgi:hypothetical protein